MRASVLVLLLPFMSVSAFGQQLAVQQPVIGMTSVSTAVAVPNHGRTYLGGISSAQSSRSRYGFGSPNRGLGVSRSSNSLSVGVTIIDLRERDEAILNSVPDRAESTLQFARHAAAINASRSEAPREQIVSAESEHERVAKFERLALKAEAENRPGVAKLHWQMAAKYGSVTARERLVGSSR